MHGAQAIEPAQRQLAHMLEPVRDLALGKRDDAPVKEHDASAFEDVFGDAAIEPGQRDPIDDRRAAVATVAALARVRVDRDADIVAPPALVRMRLAGEQERAEREDRRAGGIDK